MNTHIPLSLIGISHKTAAVKIREEVAFSKEEQVELNKKLIKEFNLKG